MEVYRIDADDLFQLREQELDSEQSLENYLIRSDGAEIGGVEVLYIDQQGSPGEGGVFDLVGLDRQGNIVIIELKRGRSPRDIVAQALEYAASIRHESYDQLEARYQEFTDLNEASLQTKHAAFFEREGDPLSKREYNTDQRLLLVGGDFSDLSLDMSDFMREHGVDVICVTYNSFTAQGEQLRLLTTENVRRPLSEEPSPISREQSRESNVEILDGDVVIEAFEEQNQSDAMQAVADYLIENHGLLDEINVPYIPGTGEGDRALINDTPTHPGGAKMGLYRDLSEDHYILTQLNASMKKSYLNELAQRCGLNARFDI